jgi:hypothetical protein
MYRDKLNTNGENMKYIYNFYARSQNCGKRQLAYASLSAWNYSSPTGRIFMKFDVCIFFRKPAEKIKVSLKSDNNIGYFT